MPERNLCRELDCPAACCRNIRGNLPARKDFFLELFLDAREVSSVGETMQKIKNKEHGVYYFVDGDRIYCSVSGDCPNLKKDLTCRVYHDKFYPEFCTNMIVGSIECYDAREICKINQVNIN